MRAVFAVRGNIDTRARELPDVLALDLVGEARTLRLLVTHIAVAGPRIRADVAKAARADRAIADRVRSLARTLHRPGPRVDGLQSRLESDRGGSTFR